MFNVFFYLFLLVMLLFAGTTTVVTPPNPTPPSDPAENIGVPLGEQFDMHLHDKATVAGEGLEMEFTGYTISITEIRPYPAHHDQTIAPEEYVATLVVTKGE